MFPVVFKSHGRGLVSFSSVTIAKTEEINMNKVVQHDEWKKWWASSSYTIVYYIKKVSTKYSPTKSPVQ